MKTSFGIWTGVYKPDIEHEFLSRDSTFLMVCYSLNKQHTETAFFIFYYGHQAVIKFQVHNLKGFINKTGSRLAPGSAQWNSAIVCSSTEHLHNYCWQCLSKTVEECQILQCQPQSKEMKPTKWRWSQNYNTRKHRKYKFTGIVDNSRVKQLRWSPDP